METAYLIVDKNNSFHVVVYEGIKHGYDGFVDLKDYPISIEPHKSSKEYYASTKIIYQVKQEHEERFNILAHSGWYDNERVEREDEYKESLLKGINIPIDRLHIDGAFVKMNYIESNVKSTQITFTKEDIINAVNHQDKECIRVANNILKALDRNNDSLFQHDPDTGLNYFNKTFKQPEYNPTKENENKD